MSNIHRCNECSRSFATQKGVFIHMRSFNHSKFAKRIEEEQKNMEDEEEEVEEKNDTKKSENHTTGSKRNYENMERDYIDLDQWEAEIINNDDTFSAFSETSSTNSHEADISSAFLAARVNFRSSHGNIVSKEQEGEKAHLCGTKNLTELTEWLQSLQKAYREN